MSYTTSSSSYGLGIQTNHNNNSTLLSTSSTNNTNDYSTSNNNAVQIEMDLSSVIRIVHQFLIEHNLVAAARSLEMESGIKGELENDVRIS